MDEEEPNGAWRSFLTLVNSISLARAILILIWARHPVDGQIRSTLKGCTEGAGLRVGSKANFSIGERAAELKINRGPSYRICFGCDDEVLIILPGGGTKRKQQNDIDVALRRWRDYKKRKREG